MQTLRTLFISLAVFALAAMALPSIAWADTYSVSITNTQFIPSTLNVSVGDTIRFINTTAATQSAKTTDTDGFNTGNIGPGENKSVVVANAGTYSYTSQYTPSLSGTVVVAASTTSTATTSTTTTSTSSATKGQPAQTQQQPVSGTFEVFMAILIAGAGFIGLGFASRRYQAGVEAGHSTVDLPSISVRSNSDDAHASEHHE
ncbi:cupredoxin domain-containing protein [Candidatus Woesebacteria bacterium]|nr:cupredoxin domain-containing protein [Candidatus Woesebacteria bacterium]